MFTFFFFFFLEYRNDCIKIHSEYSGDLGGISVSGTLQIYKNMNRARRHVIYSNQLVGFLSNFPPPLFFFLNITIEFLQTVGTRSSKANLRAKVCLRCLFKSSSYLTDVLIHQRYVQLRFVLPVKSFANPWQLMHPLFLTGVWCS